MSRTWQRIDARPAMSGSGAAWTRPQNVDAVGTLQPRLDPQLALVLASAARASGHPAARPRRTAKTSSTGLSRAQKGLTPSIRLAARLTRVTRDTVAPTADSSAIPIGALSNDEPKPLLAQPQRQVVRCGAFGELLLMDRDRRLRR